MKRSRIKARIQHYETQIKEKCYKLWYTKYSIYLLFT